MTREETVKIIRIMVDSYPNYKPSNISEMVDVWQMMLSDYPYEQIALALKAYVLSDTSGFAPSIGQLIAKMQSFTEPQELNEMEAWALVSKAIRNSTYNSVEEFAKLPPLVQKSVGLPDQLRIWAMDENYNEQVVSSNFIKCYRTVLERNKEISKMPKKVQMIIERACQGSYAAQIADKREQTVKSFTDRKENEIRAIGTSRDYSPMPESIKARMSNLFKEEP